MSDTTFQRFIDFVEQDQKIDQLQQEKEQTGLRLIELQKEIAAVKKELDDSAHAVHELRKKIDTTELDIRTLSAAIKDKQFKLNRASSPKQFFSLEHELKELESQRAVLEDQGIVLLSSLEDSQKSDKLLKELSQHKLSAFDTEIEEKNTRLFYIDKIIAAYKQEREELLPTLPEDMVSRYEQMRQRDPKPVVPLLRGSCSACFYAVSQPDIVQAQKQQLVTCKDCYRLLYIYPDIDPYNQKNNQLDAST